MREFVVPLPHQATGINAFFIGKLHINLGTQCRSPKTLQLLKGLAKDVLPVNVEPNAVLARLRACNLLEAVPKVPFLDPEIEDRGVLEQDGKRF